MSIIINNSKPSTPSSPLTPLFREFKAQKELVKSIGKVGAIPPAKEKVKFQLDNYSDHEIYQNHSNFRFAFQFSGRSEERRVGKDVICYLTSYLLIKNNI